MIVLDASVLLELLTGSPTGTLVAERLEARRAQLHAPHLIDLEVAQVLRRFAVAGEFTRERGRAALDDLADFPIHRHRHGVLLPRIWELRDSLTAYDAAYVALAELLDAPLLTRDRKIQRAAVSEAVIELI
ncbi:MAG: type II toxin-antitoxin system VapC family toxin [Pseudomonadota bacterium]